MMETATDQNADNQHSFFEDGDRKKADGRNQTGQLPHISDPNIIY